MNNLFSAGLLAISVIALNGCTESTDLKSTNKSSNYSSSTSSSSTSSSTSSSSTSTLSYNDPTTFIVTTAPTTVIKVVKEDETTTYTTTTESGNDTSDSGSTTTNTETTTETTNSDDDTTQTETNENTSVTSTVNCEAFADPIDTFVRLQIHYGLMDDAPFVAGEIGGTDAVSVTEDAAQGSTVLKLDSTIGLKAGQLITYVDTGGRYRAAEIGEVSQGSVTIKSGGGLPADISAGSNISNFYQDATHPNANGSKAIVDYSLPYASPITPNSTHLLLGDSWFDADSETNQPEIENHLKTRLPGSTIINSGVGGSTLCDLLARFDSDVVPQSPDYVWINSSINDYYNDVSRVDYKIRMQYLISKVQSIGATALVMDSAPAPGTSPAGSNLTVLSNVYAGAVLELLDQANDASTVE